MGSLWMAKSVVDGKPVYLTDYTGTTRKEVEYKILRVAQNQGFWGNVEERLKELGWEIVELEFSEIVKGDR